MVSVLNPTSQISEADLLRFNAADESYEVVNGELVAMHAVGFLHGIVAGNVYRILYEFAMQHRLGYVVGGSLIYVLEQDSDGKIIHSRIPDASFIRRLPEGFDLRRPIPHAPDLAVEVVSPSDSAEELHDKIHDYLSRETEEVWVLYTESKEVYQYRRDDPDIVRVYRGEQVIEAESLFPGSRFVVQDFFFVLTFPLD
jgi:Uma2 family endonuclease